MALESSLLAGLIVLLINVFAGSEFATAAEIHNIPHPFNRTLFPPDFIFGLASSAYQFEGAAFEDGKGPSIWDNFTHLRPCKIDNCSNGDVAVDFYHRYKDDLKRLKFIGVDALRFSISWSRVVPTGNRSEGWNKEGVEFYRNLIMDLKAHDIEPLVTLHHFDTPQGLEDAYGGFLSESIVNDFKEYADLCFKKFGDLVKYWITINEPQTYTYYGYDIGEFAPGRCSAWMNNGCAGGNSSTEPYIVAHNMLLSHAAAANLYKAKYQASQNGIIGMTLSTYWFVPNTTSISDANAARRALDFFLGWYLHPLTYGDYPKRMRINVGDRLPKFHNATTVKGSFDFLGLNYYTGNYASNIPHNNSLLPGYTADMRVNFTTARGGKPIGKPEGEGGFFIYPKGFYDLLVYIKEHYNNPTIIITETGLGDANNGTVREGVKDHERINFFYQYFTAVNKAIKVGVKVKGLFCWAFLDNMEWSSGYTVRFGSIYVDYNNGLKRYLKDSAYWLKRFLLK